MVVPSHTCAWGYGYWHWMASRGSLHRPLLCTTSTSKQSNIHIVHMHMYVLICSIYIYIYNKWVLYRHVSSCIIFYNHVSSCTSTITPQNPCENVLKTNCIGIDLYDVSEFASLLTSILLKKRGCFVSFSSQKFTLKGYTTWKGSMAIATPMKIFVCHGTP